MPTPRTIIVNSKKNWKMFLKIFRNFGFLCRKNIRFQLFYWKNLIFSGWHSFISARDWVFFFVILKFMGKYIFKPSLASLCCSELPNPNYNKSISNQENKSICLTQYDWLQKRKKSYCLAKKHYFKSSLSTYSIECAFFHIICLVIFILIKDF